MTVSDRTWLEQAVLLDVAYRGQVIGSEGLRGNHSILLNDGPAGHRQFRVTDGRLLNEVHEQMIAYVGNQQREGAVVIVEYATGPVAEFGPGKERLLQDGSSLLGGIHETRAGGRLFLLDVEAPLEIRALRNSGRPDGLDDETFRRYFQDGGEVDALEAQAHGIFFHRLENGYHDPVRFAREVETIYTDIVSPRLSNEGRIQGELR
ncbi:hypothetical protein M1555_05265 [Patescibacteria group bacterium]|nr:hypothetical protein [Patescibacteria group bacterium]